jgi:hypothetical protein
MKHHAASTPPVSSTARTGLRVRSAVKAGPTAVERVILVAIAPVVSAPLAGASLQPGG